MLWIKCLIGCCHIYTLNIIIEKFQTKFVKTCDQHTKNSIHKYGGTICLNGSDNINSYPLLNIMLDCLNEDLFLGTITWKGIGKMNGLKFILELKKNENYF
jgi:hypothetical protein